MYVYFILVFLVHLSQVSSENCYSYRSLYNQYEPSQYCGSFLTCCGTCYSRYCCGIGSIYNLNQNVCSNDWIYTPVSTIVGSIVGGVFFLVALIVLIIICRRRRVFIFRRPGVVIVPPGANPNYYNGGYVPPQAYPAPSIPNVYPQPAQSSQVPHAFPSGSYQNNPPTYTK
jgi:hypothetical protein